MSKMPSLTLIGLPPETISHIIDIADPSTHLNIACTCSHLHKYARKALEYHREAHQKFSVASDHDPSTIPTLLRSASGITSPIDAWHVRHIELWGSRWNWVEWRPWALYTNSTALHTVSKRRQVFLPSPALKWSIPCWELAHYLEIMRTELGLPEDFVDLARAEFDKGCDSVIQMLLIVLCPRLESLKYMYNKHDKVAYRRSLYWLTSVMGKSYADGSWPPGLRKLRDVAVGVRSETWFDEKYDKLWYARSCFRGFLKLPSIQSLYFRGLRPQDQPSMPSDLNWNLHPGGKSIFDSSLSPGFEDADQLPARCSEVKHLYLESIGDYRDLEILATALKALESYTLHGGNIHFGSDSSFDELLEAMVEKQRQSLESILAYNGLQFEGNDCRLYQIGEGEHIKLHSCPKLRQLTFHWDDLIFLSYNFPWGAGKLKDAWKDPKKRQDCVDYILDLFPTSLEVLIIGASKDPRTVANHTSETISDFFDYDGMGQDILVCTVSSKRLPAIRAIFIERSDDDCEFAELFKVGQEKGVDIHVKTNPQAPHEIQFPEPPYVLSHRSQQDTSGWHFDPFNGCYLRTSRVTELDGQANGLPFDNLLEEELDAGDETDHDCNGLPLYEF